MFDKINKFDMLGKMVYRDKDSFFFFKVGNSFCSFGSAHDMEDQRFHIRRAKTKKRIREIEMESELIRHGGRGYELHGGIDDMCRAHPDWWPDSRKMRLDEYITE